MYKLGEKCIKWLSELLSLVVKIIQWNSKLNCCIEKTINNTQWLLRSHACTNLKNIGLLQILLRSSWQLGHL